MRTRNPIQLEPLTYNEIVQLVRRVEAKLNDKHDGTVTITVDDAANLCERVRTLLQILDPEHKFPVRF